MPDAIDFDFCHGRQIAVYDSCHSDHVALSGRSFGAVDSLVSSQRMRQFEDGCQNRWRDTGFVASSQFPSLPGQAEVIGNFRHTFASFNPSQCGAVCLFDLDTGTLGGDFRSNLIRDLFEGNRNRIVMLDHTSNDRSIFQILDCRAVVTVGEQFICKHTLS